MTPRRLPWRIVVGAIGADAARLARLPVTGEKVQADAIEDRADRGVGLRVRMRQTLDLPEQDLVPRVADGPVVQELPQPPGRCSQHVEQRCRSTPADLPRGE